MNDIKPKIRGSLCVNADPEGCRQNVRSQIQTSLNAAQSYTPATQPKTVLIIGGSAGYGLASRIVSQVFYGANTISVSLEKAPTDKKAGSAGLYNNETVTAYAENESKLDLSINGDAFQIETKNQMIELLQSRGLKVDLLVYSVAAPRRTVIDDAGNPHVYQSVIKPVGQEFEGQTIDVSKEVLQSFSIEPANEEEIEHTVNVMGGEDWHLWVNLLREFDLITEQFQTVSFSYLGGDVTRAIYRDGTLGKAKENLEEHCEAINAVFADSNPAKVAVLKAIVTQSSAAIPSLSVYISALYKVMKESGTHEDCITQIIRLFSTGLYPENTLQCGMDKPYRFRLDEFELDATTQAKVKDLVESISQEQIYTSVDFDGFKQDFLQLFGFAKD